MIDPVIENLIAIELAKLQMPQGQLNDFNVDERNSAASSVATDVKSLNIVPQETFEESEALNNLDVSAVSSNVDHSIPPNITFSEDNDETGEPLDSQETNTKDKSLEFPKSLQQTTINFYLKDSEGYCKNVNVEKCFSKTEKELFKVLQASEENANSHKTTDNLIGPDGSVS